MKTAIEWLANELTYKTNDDRYIIDNTDDVTDIVNQAKQMEKEQIIKACNDTIKSVELDSDKTGFIAQTGEGYYNKTYNK
jgi:hypothetical protein